MRTVKVTMKVVATFETNTSDEVLQNEATLDPVGFVQDTVDTPEDTSITVDVEEVEKVEEEEEDDEPPLEDD